MKAMESKVMRAMRLANTPGQQAAIYRSPKCLSRSPAPAKC